MPELPEVETVVRGLAAHLIHARIDHIEVRRRDLRVPLPRGLEKTFAGAKLTRITRRAKYILMHFNGARVLIVHLGMSGKLVLKAKPANPLKHDHVVITFTDGRTLTFNDARRFGLMTWADEKDLATHKLFAGLGPEPLDENWGSDALFDLLGSSRAPIKSAIMDQSRLVGVGNIYASEALFRAGIRPDRAANTVNKREAVKLAAAVRAVLEEAIQAGGSTLRDYVRSSGDAGYFQHHFKVYGRAGLPCIACGHPVKIMRQAGRSSFFCSTCQR